MSNRAAMVAKLAELETEVARAVAGGGEKYVERHHARGKLLPRERIELLVDEGSAFLELSPLAGWGSDFHVGASLVTGIGVVEGVECLITANDPTVKGGASNPWTVKKAFRAAQIAEENHLPTISLVESGGADLPTQKEIFIPGGKLFRDLTRASARRQPTIALVFGNSTAGGAYVPGMSDYTVMVKEQAKVFLAHDVPHREDACRLAALDDHEVAEAASDHRLRRAARATSRSARTSGSPTGDWPRARGRGPPPRRATRSTSRSVIIPGPSPLGVDGPPPPRRCARPSAPAASRSVWLGPTLSITRAHPLPDLHAALLPVRGPLAAIDSILPDAAPPSDRALPGTASRQADHCAASSFRPFARIPDVPTQRPATIRLRTSLFEEAARIVEREFAPDLSLDDIARRVASSRRQLQRAFAEVGHTTFRDHLTRGAHGAGRRAAGRRRLTVREVAHRVGYRQPAQFAKAFRRHHGVAPSAFRASRGRALRGTPRRSPPDRPAPRRRPDDRRPARRRDLCRGSAIGCGLHGSRRLRGARGAEEDRRASGRQPGTHALRADARDRRRGVGRRHRARPGDRLVPHGRRPRRPSKIDTLWDVLLIASVPVFVLVEVVVALQRRALPHAPGRGARRPADPRQHPLEIVWTAIPAILLVGARAPTPTSC